MVSAIDAVDSLDLAPLESRINGLEIQMKAVSERQYQLSESIMKASEKSSDAIANSRETAAMVGGFLPFGLYGGYGLSSAARKEIGEALDLAKKGDYTKVKQFKTWSEPAVQAGFGAGIEGVSQLVQGEFDPSRILISGMMMPLVSGDKTRLGKALTFENVLPRNSD